MAVSDDRPRRSLWEDPPTPGQRRLITAVLAVWVLIGAVPATALALAASPHTTHNEVDHGASVFLGFGILTIIVGVVVMAGSALVATRRRAKKNHEE